MYCGTIVDEAFALVIFHFFNSIFSNSSSILFYSIFICVLPSAEVSRQLRSGPRGEGVLYLLHCLSLALPRNADLYFLLPLVSVEFVVSVSVSNLQMAPFVFSSHYGSSDLWVIGWRWWCGGDCG